MRRNSSYPRLKAWVLRALKNPPVTPASSTSEFQTSHRDARLSLCSKMLLYGRFCAQACSARHAASASDDSRLPPGYCIRAASHAPRQNWHTDNNGGPEVRSTYDTPSLRPNCSEQYTGSAVCRYPRIFILMPSTLSSTPANSLLLPQNLRCADFRMVLFQPTSSREL